MKTLFRILGNWRYYVLAALFYVGFFAVATAFGDTDEHLSSIQWLAHFVLSLAAGVVGFGLLAALIKRWERQGTIPEITNLKIH